MPRGFSSGAASLWSYGLYSPKYLVIAAVRLVLPWSTCPIVPMFTCGFVRSNLPFAIVSFLGGRTEILFGMRGDYRQRPKNASAFGCCRGAEALTRRIK